MKRLVLMMGVSGAGKSTYIKQMAPILFGAHDYKYVSRDEIRFKLLEEEGEKTYFGVENKVWGKWVHKIKTGLEDYGTVIADATHLTKGSRLKLIKALDIKPEEIWVIWVDAPLATCLAQNAQIEGLARVPEEVIRNMYEGLEPPHYKEGKVVYDKILIKHPNSIETLKEEE